MVDRLLMEIRLFKENKREDVRCLSHDRLLASWKRSETLISRMDSN